MDNYTIPKRIGLDSRGLSGTNNSRVNSTFDGISNPILLMILNPGGILMLKMFSLFSGLALKVFGA